MSTEQPTICKTLYGRAFVRQKDGMDVLVKETSLEAFNSRQSNEDVRNEANAFRWLGLVGSNKENNELQLNATHIDLKTAGLSSSVTAAHLTPAYTNDLASGTKYLCRLVDERENDTTHSLELSYAERGDLFNIIVSSSEANCAVDLEQNRTWFRQLVMAVRWMHARSMAHLDLSMENVCINNRNEVQLIDLGLATFHPQCHAAPLDVEPMRMPLAVRLLATQDGTSGCVCSACSTGVAWLAKAHESTVSMSKKAPVPCKFLLRPVCHNALAPGKLRSVSPELLSDARNRLCLWDAYKCDVFALGTILFTMLTRCMPFQVADRTTDKWAELILSGKWLRTEVRFGWPGAKHYANLPDKALAVMDACFQPQHLRPSVDEILSMPWLAESSVC